MQVSNQFSRIIPLTIILLGLVSYNFMSAQWSGAPANPPNNNVAPPINNSIAPQLKSGNFGANLIIAATSTWSPRYCDGSGNNCITTATMGGGDGLGVGQTWRNVSASRTRNVWYQNTTGKPISVYVWVDPGDGFLYANTIGSDTGQVMIAGPDNDSGTRDNLFGIIPDGHWYKQTGRAVTTWSELR